MSLDFTPRFSIEDPNGNTFNLWVTQDENRDIFNDVNQTQIPYQQPGDNINFVLGQEEEQSISGIATYDVATQSSSYSDSEQGLAEWVQDLFSITGAQGTSHTITDNLTGESFSGYINSFSFQMSWPREHRIQWDIQIIKGQGIVPYSSTSAKTANPGQTATLDGIELGNPVDFSMSKDVETQTEVIPDPSGDKGAEANFVSEEGTSFNFDMSFNTRRKAILDEIRQMRELNKTYTFQSPFPGASYDVQVDDFNKKSDSETRVEYDLTLVQ